ncbi:MAG: alpha amylase C-terminal domain-containing protein, partial [Nitrospirae bacterium]|nr:alpha amylase C-terminal domain-containing protein [Nitrospirota bacterium]
FEGRGFEWVDYSDWEQSSICFLRKGNTTDDLMLVACNFTPVPRRHYMIGVPRGGFWKECLNSDAVIYGGSGQGNLGGAEAVPVSYHGRQFSLSLVLPPLSVVFLKNEAKIS